MPIYKTFLEIPIEIEYDVDWNGEIELIETKPIGTISEIFTAEEKTIKMFVENELLRLKELRDQDNEYLRRIPS